MDTKHYRQLQFSKILPLDSWNVASTKIQLITPTGVTHYMTISEEELKAIQSILTK